MSYQNLEVLPYRVETKQTEQGEWLAVIPTLGDHLFRGAGRTIEEALFVLNDIVESLIDWLVQSGQDFPDPTQEDIDALTEKPGAESFGLRCIISDAPYASTRLQPAFGTDAHVQRGPSKRVLHHVSTEFFSAAC